MREKIFPIKHIILMGKASDEWEGKEEDVSVKQKLQYTAMRTANE